MFRIDFKNIFKNPKSFALFLSISLHGALFIFCITNLSIFKKTDIPNQIRVIELTLPISNKTNLPIAKTKEKKVVKNEKTKKTPSESNQSKKTLPKTTTDLKPKKNNTTQKKTTKKQSESDQKKSEDNSIDNLLKSLEGQIIQKTSLESELESLNSSDTFDESEALTISELDAIKSQIQKCWTEPAGGLNKEGLYVLLRIKLLIDGNLEGIKVIKGPKTDNMIMNQLATDTAVRAIKMCAPYKMPANSYNSWKEIEIMFDPRDM